VEFCRLNGVFIVTEYDDASMEHRASLYECFLLLDGGILYRAHGRSRDLSAAIRGLAWLITGGQLVRNPGRIDEQTIFVPQLKLE
jgi:hypothetical protein